MMPEVLKEYPDAWQIQAGEAILNVSKHDRSVGWMQNWGLADSLEAAGILKSVCYGPSTYNHVTLFWADGISLARAIRWWGQS